MEFRCQEISSYSGVSLVATTVVTVLLVGLVDGYLLQEQVRAISVHIVRLLLSASGTRGDFLFDLDV